MVSELIIPAYSARTTHLAHLLEELDLLTVANKQALQQGRKHARKPLVTTKVISGIVTPLKNQKREVSCQTEDIAVDPVLHKRSYSHV